MKTQALKPILATMTLSLFATNIQAEMSGILKKGVSQYEAERVCADEGMRLPTIQELALVAQHDHDACGILTPDEYQNFENTEDCKKRNYSFIKESDSQGNHFYFSYENYKAPAGELGSSLFWSSSAHSDSINAYFLNGFDGGIAFIDRSFDVDNLAVRCVRSR